MRKIFCLGYVVFILGVKGYAQATTQLSAADSIEILRQLQELFSSTTRSTSYGLLSFGIGNQLFSIKNRALNTKQSNTHVLVYSPSAGYFHKTGFGISAAASLLDDQKKFGVTQYMITPSYDYSTRAIGIGASYTQYFVKDKFSQFSSPIQHDFYGTFVYRKSWLRPGIAAGYSTGEYKEVKYKDTTLGNVHRRWYDSITNNLRAFSLTLSASHQFLWYGVFTESDGLSFTPTLMLNGGSSKTAIEHKTNARGLYNFLVKRGRIPKFRSREFEMQSMGINLGAIFSIGDFSLDTQFYTDYYLPEADSDTDRLTMVFSFNLNYAL